jgi:hypothetical protein
MVTPNTARVVQPKEALCLQGSGGEETIILLWLQKGEDKQKILSLKFPLDMQVKCGNI